MGDDEDCTTVFVACVLKGKGHAVRALLIEGRRGLVQEQKGLWQSEGCCKEKALTLTARELWGREIEEGIVKSERAHQSRTGFG